MTAILTCTAFSCYLRVPSPAVFGELPLIHQSEGRRCGSHTIEGTWRLYCPQNSVSVKEATSHFGPCPNGKPTQEPGLDFLGI